MTQQTTPTPDGPLLPYPGWTPSPKRPIRPALLVARVLVAAAVLGCLLYAAWPYLKPAPSEPTTHTVLYEATADAAYGAGRTGMVTAQAPGGTTQRTGLLPITGTYSFGTGDFVYLSVQNQQPAGSVTCRITVDGVVVSENTSTGGYTIASCKGQVP
jgi:hypothetical protein